MYALSLLTLLSGVALVIAVYALRFHLTERNLLKYGQMAEAKILKADHYISHDGTTIVAKLILLVRPATMRWFVSELKYRLPLDRQLSFTTGASVLVKFSRKNKNQVLIVDS